MIGFWWLSLLLVACDTVPTSGDPFSPVPVTAPAPVAPPVARDADPGAASPGTFDFEAEDRPADDAGPGEDDPIALQARLLGVDPRRVQGARSARSPSAVVRVAEPPTLAPTAPPGVDWGIRLLATLADVHPPRAVIGLPDGTEKVVQPGAMLPAQRLVVLAVGRDAVQLARISPEGFYARVEPITVHAMFPAARPQSP